MNNNVTYHRVFVSFLIVSLICVFCPVISAAKYEIDIFPTTIHPDETIKVILNDIPQKSIINMTIDGSISVKPGEESSFLMRNFKYPYYDPAAYYLTETFDLEPGTEAESSVEREDGTLASYIGNANETGHFNASIIHELNPAQYNVSFVGIPASEHMRHHIDFGSQTREDNSTEEPTTGESRFTPSGFDKGEMIVSVYIDHVLQKTQTITVI